MVASAPTTIGFGGGGSAGEPEKKVACGCRLSGFGFSRWSVEVRLDTLIRKVQIKIIIINLKTRRKTMIHNRKNMTYINTVMYNIRMKK